MNLDELGTWDGDMFRFHEPIRVGEAVMESVSFADYEEGDGVTREDVLHALLNPVKVVWEEPPDAG